MASAMRGLFLQVWIKPYTPLTRHEINFPQKHRLNLEATENKSLIYSIILNHFLFCFIKFFMILPIFWHNIAEVNLTILFTS